MDRTQAERGSGTFDFNTVSPPTLTGKIAGFEVDEAMADVEILNEHGVDVTSTVLNGGTTCAVNAKVYAEKGLYFSSVTASAGQISYLNA